MDGCWLKIQHSKNEDHGIQSHHFMANRWGNGGNSDRLFFLGLQNHCRWWLQPWKDRKAWRLTVHGVAESDTTEQLNNQEARCGQSLRVITWLVQTGSRRTRKMMRFPLAEVLEHASGNHLPGHFAQVVRQEHGLASFFWTEPNSKYFSHCSPK